jgi:glycosyltransferase involved in cell wall biosynthesis
MHAGDVVNPVAVAHLKPLLACDVIHCLQPRTIVTDLALLWGWMFGRRTFLTDLAGGAPIRPSQLIPMRNLMTGFLPISEYNRALNPWVHRPTTVIYGGVDAAAFVPDPTAVRHADRVLYVGRLFEGKGLHILMEALPPGVSLDVVGGGQDAAFRTRVTALAEGKSVVFHGALPDADVVRLYQRATLVVLPSLVDSGFTSSMEAMACGTPVLGTRLGSLPEVVREGVTGWLVPAGDVPAMRAAIVDAVSDLARLRTMGEAARADVLERFTWARVADRCLQAYGLPV